MDESGTVYDDDRMKTNEGTCDDDDDDDDDDEDDDDDAIFIYILFTSFCS